MCLWSSIYWFIHSTGPEFIWERTETTSSAFAHPSVIAVFTPAQKIRTKRGNKLEFDSIKTDVNPALNFTHSLF